MTVGWWPVSLADLEPAVQDAIVNVLAAEAEQTGDTAPLEFALVYGDVLGGREPVQVPRDVRDQLAQVLTDAIDDAG
jgi:hypothetical protein